MIEGSTLETSCAMFVQIATSQYVAMGYKVQLMIMLKINTNKCFEIITNGTNKTFIKFISYGQ